MPHIITNELTRSIYNGTLATRLTVENLSSNPAEIDAIIALIQQTPPFAQDEALLGRVATQAQVADNASDGSLASIAHKLNQLRALSDPNRLNTIRRVLANDLLKLNHYFTKLQARLTYETFTTHLSQAEVYRNVLPQTPLAEMAMQYINNPTLHAHYLALNNQHNYAAFQHISGDGNCYFRAIMQSFITQAICAPAADRTALFNHLAGLIRRELLNKANSCFRQDYPSNSPMIRRMEQLANKLERAAQNTCWSTLQEFRRDQMDTNPDGDDLTLICAARHLVAECVMENLNTEFNGMSLYHSLPGALDGNFNITTYRQQAINQMGRCAEGPWVDVSLLPRLLGARERFFIIAANVANLEARHQGEIPAFRARYQLNDVPQTTLSLAFRPGHYDALLTTEDYQRQLAHLQRAAYQPINAAAPNRQPNPEQSSQPEKSAQQLITSIDHDYTRYLPTLERLSEQLEALLAQAYWLRAEQNHTSANQVELLHWRLLQTKEQYCNPQQWVDLAQFQSVSKALIHDAMQQLNQHPNVKQLLWDILNLILFPIGLINWAVHGRFRLFASPQTNTCQAIQAVDKTIAVLAN